MTDENRPSKKQRELLTFVDNFISGHGYGPSYREIMTAMGYKSVSTVAVHIDGLIRKGYLQKSDYSARSVELVAPRSDQQHLTWLEQQAAAFDANNQPEQAAQIRQVHTLLTTSPADGEVLA